MKNLSNIILHNDSHEWIEQSWLLLKNKRNIELEKLCQQINTRTISKQELAFYYFYLARVNFYNQNYDVSEKYMDIAIDLFQVSENELWVNNTKLHLANDFVTIGKFNSALGIFNELLEKSKTINSQFYNIVLIDYSICCFYGSTDDDSWIEKLEEAYTRANNSQNDYYAFCALANLVSFLTTKSIFNQAIVYVEKASQFLTEKAIVVDERYYMSGNSVTPKGIQKEELDISYIYSVLLTRKGSLYFELGDYEKSIESYSKAFSLFQSVEFSEIKAYIANSLAIILCKQNHFEKAIILLSQCVNYYKEKSPNSEHLVTSLSNLAEAKLNSGFLIEAEDLYQQALKLSSTLNIPVSIATINMEIANIHICQRQFNTAIDKLVIAVETAQRINQVKIVIQCYRMLGICYMQTDINRAYDYFMKAMFIAEEYNNKDEQHYIYKEVSTYYRLTGDIPQAFSYFEKYTKLREDLFSQEADRKLRNLMVLYEVAEYKSKLEITTSKIKQLELELEIRTRELSAMVISIMEKQELVKLLEKGLTDILDKNPTQRDSEIRNFIRNLRKVGEAKQDWEEINKMFLEVHKDCVASIMKLAPDITPTELKTCILVRLSMSSKQIAQILKISERSVENHRNHARRKLGINKDLNLTTYLISLV
ncbi:MAG: LuxR family transcriptional regulator [Candidatus Kapaibacterium sp.]